MSSIAKYNSYSWCCKDPKYSVTRSIKTGNSRTSCCSNQGKTRSLSISTDNQRILVVIEFSESYPSISVEESLLENAADSFESTNKERGLRTLVVEMLGFNLAVSFFILTVLLHALSCASVRIKFS